MDRINKLKLNTVTSLLNRIATIISGLIIPRLILLYFGSSINGLVASITQFLSIITFLDLGIGSVVQSALYKPLANKDKYQINSILIAARNYFKKIAYVLVLYVLGLTIFYPVFVDSSYGIIPTTFLIIALSISSFGQYYFGIVNELLLNAAQTSYIQYASEIVVVVLNVLLSVVLIRIGANIQTVKLGAGLIYLIRPIFLNYYVKRNFDINYNADINEEALPQKWSGVGQHIAFTIQNSTDIIILSIFSSLENVSIYSIYNMIVEAIRMLITSLTTGVGSFFGDLIANNELKLLNNYFNKIEWIVHTSVIFLYGMTVVLINPFVMIYTSGVEDINYYAPVFSFLLVQTKILSSIRIPYRNIIFSAGHFKETQSSAFIEAGLNLVLSFLLVQEIGLIGVTIGSIISMAYLDLYLVYYLSRNILFRPMNKFYKHLIVDLVVFGLIYFTGRTLMNIIPINTLGVWLFVAILLGLISLVIIYLINYIFYKNIMFSTIKSIMNRS